MDRALRAVATGLAQVMERYARRSQDGVRESAARVREDWLAQRDAARRQYLPWLREGALEKLDPAAASRRWAAAASWSGMDPTARAAEQEMAQRIQAAHGQHPSVLINFADRSALPKDDSSARPMLTMNQAYDLAQKHAPSWYAVPAEVQRLEQDRPPNGQIEEDFHTDWQYFAEAGALPEVSQWEQWSRHVDRGDEFEEVKWLDDAGILDSEGRENALERLWVEGSEARTSLEAGDHEAAMHEAGMGSLDDHIGLPDEVVVEQSWHAFLTPSRFDAASPEEVATAWRDASAAALVGDVGAQRSAERLATMMRERRGLSPEGALIGTLAERAAVNAEARRAAEDRERRTAEAARVSTPTAATAPLVAAVPPTAGAASAPSTAARSGRTASGSVPAIARERVIELNHMAADFYAGKLRPGTQGHRYLVDRLGSDVDSGPWALGYAPGGWMNLCNHLRSQGASDDEMLAAGLAEPGIYGVRDTFRDRVMMGIRDHESGEIVGFLGRDLSGDPRAPKVKNTSETPAFRKGDYVFGLYEAGPDAKLVRVEGPFDALATSLASEGRAAGVSTMGTAMTGTQAAAIAERAGRNENRVWVANDNDAGGQKATEEDFYRLSERGLDVRQLQVPGSDPAAAWQTAPELFRSELADLEHARSAAETVVDRYLASPEATRTGFGVLMTELEPHLRDPIERDLLALRVAEVDATSSVRSTAEAREAAARGDRDAAQAALAGLAVDPDDRRLGDGSPAADRDGSVPAHGDGLSSAGRSVVDERADDLEADAAASEEYLDAAEGFTDDARAEQAAAYDRRDEAMRDAMSSNAETARDGSSHGFSRSTQDQLQAAPQSRKGAAAKVQRGPGNTRSAGRTLRRS
ncbi:toprim domain-containing protein [Pimelobacter simplex]|uniref:toprim domain-containing protein n=2 Tax=Pimelobacter TaxID=2044 RepID=UPI00214FB634|nr:toprim domain-containing protein [Pimelobacter simplex]UUW93016.1 toprim domain-containing protein [Pimelobacter simplex]UUW99049.1 toprim domain-containing protein [Pimelobacter simplex]